MLSVDGMFSVVSLNDSYGERLDCHRMGPFDASQEMMTVLLVRHRRYHRMYQIH